MFPHVVKVIFGETITNVEVPWDKQSNSMGKANLFKDIKDNLDHVFNWSVLTNAPENIIQLKVVGVYYILLEKLTLNEQLEPAGLHLFQNGVE